MSVYKQKKAEQERYEFKEFWRYVKDKWKEEKNIIFYIQRDPFQHFRLKFDVCIKKRINLLKYNLFKIQKSKREFLFEDSRDKIWIFN